ncbi:arginine deiminase family protein [Fodinicurvata sp. EGI_FJ10296]|uniref:dimethylarginine dimethylaminohydrolase family protein n=1 Tax=Fodinicurvata sp. EGI_FJ10296 TaxID=3231908 RepID=UPI0034534BA5
MQWGVGSETGVLTDVLLCRPDHYDWIPTNVVAKAALAAGEKPEPAEVAAQFRELESALDTASVRRHYLTPDPHLPYQVYTRDSSQMTPWGAVVTQLFRPQRRGEYASILEFYQSAGIPIWGYATHGSLEGGDIHIIRPGLALIGHSGERTSEVGARQFAGWLEDAAGWEVRLYPFAEHFLHLDLLFCMVTDGLALVCEDVLEPDLLNWIDARGIRRLPVSYRDAMALGANILALGNDRVISPAHQTGLNDRLRAEGIEVLAPAFDLLTRGGGGVHCATMPLNRLD